MKKALTNNLRTSCSQGANSPTTSSSSTPPDEQDHQRSVCKQSFASWSPDVPLDFDAMAEAGWCNIGDGRVNSFCCKTVLNWKATDDPWQQHARYSPECSFLKQQKGQAYIDRVKAGLPTVDGEPVMEQHDIQLSPQDDSATQMLQENEMLRKQQNCWVCEEEPRRITYLPCAELACCLTCDPAQLKCPICKETITCRIITFLS